MIKGTLSDEYLANRISNIDNTIEGEEIRKILQKMLQNRLEQLDRSKEPKRRTNHFESRSKDELIYEDKSKRDQGRPDYS